MSYDYATPTAEPFAEGTMKTWLSADQRTLHLQLENVSLDTSAMLSLADVQGRVLVNEKLGAGREFQTELPQLTAGVYFVTVSQGSKVLFEQRVVAK